MLAVVSENWLRELGGHFLGQLLYQSAISNNLLAFMAAVPDTRVEDKHLGPSRHHLDELRNHPHLSLVRGG